MVMVEGHMELDQWQDKQSGAKRSRLKVVAENVQFLRIKKPDDDPLLDPAAPRSLRSSLPRAPHQKPPSAPSPRPGRSLNSPTQVWSELTASAEQESPGPAS